MKDELKPSKKLISYPYDGKEIKDELGRTITLRHPSLVDEYYLKKAMGTDSDITQCWQTMAPLMFVAKIDNQVIQNPTFFSDCIVNLKLLGREGAIAVLEEISKTNTSDVNQEKEEIKK